MKAIHFCFLCFFCLGVILGGCIRPVELDLPELPRKVVLQGILSPDKPITVYLAYHQAISDSARAFPWITNALVQVYENGQVKDTLVHFDSGTYVTSTFPREGRTYRIEVEVPGEPIVAAETRLPFSIPLDSATYQFSTRTNSEGVPLMDYSGYFSDPGQEANGYQIFFFRQVREQGVWTEFFPGLNNADVIDPAILAEETGIFPHRFGSSGFLFSDATFNGEEYEVQLSFPTDQDPMTYVPSNQRNWLGLHHLDPHYFRYQKSLKLHLRNQASNAVFGPGDFDFIELIQIGQPTELYSNVENGLGILASFSFSKRTCRFIR
ncbi:MAG: DUF4249 domain-containing protein [Bacteroidota bacterium]